MSLPWDRFKPDTPEPPPPPVSPNLPAPVEPTPPRPSVPAPAPPPAAPLNADIAALGKDILAEAMQYAKDSVSAIMSGKTVDVLHPTVTAEDHTGRELVVADAKSRSWRTLVQGLIFDVFAAIVAVVATLSGADPFQRETWIAFGVLLLKSVVSAVISYFMRLRVTPTIRTEGEKMALMPVPRPMINDERNAA